MKKLVYLTIIVVFVYACSNNTSNNENENENEANTEAATEESADEVATQMEYDERVGHGQYTEENLDLQANADPELVEKGNAIYSAKCQSCHKLSNELLVGPGFEGVSERRTPVWIMNFLTNTDEMIDLDPALQEQLEVCMVRMPDQRLTEGDALALVDFFRENDNN